MLADKNKNVRYTKMTKSFDDLLAKVSECSKKTVAVACAQDDAVLEAVKAAKERGIADAILVGNEAEIKTIARTLKMHIDDYKIINVEDPIEAARTAVKLVHDGEADMYMKGLIDTKSFLKSVLDKEVGLRTDKTLSHVCVFEIRKIVMNKSYRNTVEIAHACGVECPKVAPLAAVEVENPKMQCTVDAVELTKMNENGDITGCIVDGPLSLDLAIEPQAAFHKGTTNRKIVGDADVLLFPDIHAGNITYKCLVHTAECKNGNILTGTSAPVILTSRSDEFEVKVNSIALAAIVAEEMNK